MKQFKTKTIAIESVEVEFYGNDEIGWSGSVNDAHHDGLKSCPFCGSSDVVLQNTHTPSYSVWCQDCGAEKPDDVTSGEHPKSLSVAKELHRLSIRSAIREWNTRA